ncbi:cellulose biosynthesis protein BcsD [Lonsdalea quercina]|uniref:cellulose biosynthesis protein BcsD n=1 Tax=Lonsdalea quercina TaxID=71657 RepID=UPI003F44E58E
MSEWQQTTLQYYRQQQCPPGWFDLLGIIIENMMNNVGESEGQAFLQQMGEALAKRYPLPAALTVADLEREINAVLAVFDWGYVELLPGEASLEILHLALPAGEGALSKARWLLAIKAVLQGLYAHWLKEQGGGTHVPLVGEATEGETALRFRYQHN